MDLTIDDEILNQYEGLIYSMAKRVPLLPGYEFEDVLQLARLGAWNGIRTYSSDGGSELKSWLITCMRHELKGLLDRTERRLEELPEVSLQTRIGPDNATALEDVLADNRRSTYSIVEEKQAAGIISEYVDMLNPRHRSIVKLVAEGYTLKEIAPMLGYPNEWAVGTALNHARRRIAGMVEAHGHKDLFANRVRSDIKPRSRAK